MKTLSFILPAWNGAAFIGECLSSLVPQLQVLDTIIVVDNDSTDGTPELVGREFPHVTILRQGHNLGYGGGANRGIAQARTDAVVIFNQDIVFKEVCVAALRRRLEISGPAVIGGKLFYPDGRTIQHAGGKIRMPRGDPDHYGYRQVDDGSYDQVMETDYVTGALFVIDRKVLAAIGGFDEDFFPAYYEEVDYCYRARKARFPIIYEPEAVAIHHESQTYGQRSAAYYQAMSRGRLRFLLKHLSTAQFCTEFAPAEKLWLTDVRSLYHRRMSLHAYLRAMLMVPELAARGWLGDSTTASPADLLEDLEQLGHFCAQSVMPGSKEARL